jgi:ribosomal protein L19
MSRATLLRCCGQRSSSLLQVKRYLHKLQIAQCSNSTQEQENKQESETEQWFYNRGWPYEPLYGPRPKYPKRKSPVKRAISLMRVVESDEIRRLLESNRAMLPKSIPDLAVGDVIRLKIVDPSDESKVQWFTGRVIHLRKAYTGSSVTLRNVVNEVAVERVVPLYSPWIREAYLLDRKPTDKQDLFYLRERPLKESSCGPMEPPELANKGNRAKK